MSTAAVAAQVEQVRNAMPYDCWGRRHLLERAPAGRHRWRLRTTLSSSCWRPHRSEQLLLASPRLRFLLTETLSCENDRSRIDGASRALTMGVSFGRESVTKRSK